MGSSAALATALVRARHPDLTPEQVIDAAMPIERAFHGNPSGLDVAVSARGGGLLYRRGPPMQMERVEPGDWQVVVLDSGAPGNTAELVAAVAARRPGDGEATRNATHPARPSPPPKSESSSTKAKSAPPRPASSSTSASTTSSSASSSKP
jgi:mevalonate kinase